MSKTTQIKEIIRTSFKISIDEYQKRYLVRPTDEFFYGFMSGSAILTSLTNISREESRDLMRELKDKFDNGEV